MHLVEPLGNGDERSVDVASRKRRQCQDFSDIFFIGWDLFMVGGFDDEDFEVGGQIVGEYTTLDWGLGFPPSERDEARVKESHAL